MIALIVHAVTRPVRHWYQWVSHAFGRWRRPLTIATTTLNDVVSDESEEIVYDPSPAALEVFDDPPAATDPEPSPSTHAQINRRPRLSSPHETGASRWHLRGAILDRLDEYFTCLRQVRLRDPDSYALFSRVGLTVPPDVYANPDYPQHTFIPSMSFGGCLYSQGEDGDDNKVYPSFMYFNKVTHPSRVQYFAGTVYVFTCVYDQRRIEDRWRSRLACVVSCFIGVTPSGEMTLLREPVHERHEVTRGLRQKHGRRETLRLTTTRWAYPSWITDVLAENAIVKDPEKWITGLLKQTFLTHQSAIQKVTIRVRKNAAECAMFGVDISRAKYFFQDRDVEAVASDGRKKRIFHAVREHVRRVADGERTVRQHYRGLRDFHWNTYAIHIVWPKTRVLDCPVPSVFKEDIAAADRREYIGQGGMGERLAEVLDR